MPILLSEIIHKFLKQNKIWLSLATLMNFREICKFFPNKIQVLLIL